MTRLKIGVFVLVLFITSLIPDSTNSYTEPTVYAYSQDMIAVEQETPELSRQELHCLVLNTYHEARGESEAGKIAVMQVVLNRTESDKFPGNICDVVTQGPTRVNQKGEIIPLYDKCQFKWFCDGKNDIAIDMKEYNNIKRLAIEVIQNKTIDITNNSMYYHSTRSTPYWGKVFQRTVQIDNHIFYKERS